MASENRPAHLFLGMHSADNQAFLTQVYNAGDRLLSTSSRGRIYWFFEEYTLSLVADFYIKGAIEGRVKPSNAFLRGTFVNHYARIPSSRELNHWKSEYYTHEPHLAAELKQADRLETKYPGRVHILTEGVPLEILERIIAEDDPKDLFDQAREQTTSGHIENAQEPFQSAVQILVNSTPEREETIANRMIDALGERDVLGVVGHLGAAHTGVFHRLRAKGINATYTFDKLDGYRSYYFDPATSLARKRLIKPHIEVTQLGWFQAILGDALYKLLTLLGSNDQNAAGGVNNLILREFSSTAKILAFQDKIRELGFAEAARTL